MQIFTVRNYLLTLLFCLFLYGLYLYSYAYPLKCKREQFEQYSQYQSAKNSSAPYDPPSYALPPRPYIETSASKSQTTKCPDKLKETRNGVLAFRINEQHSNSNPLVFTSMEDYQQYAKNMNELYGCPILNIENYNEDNIYLDNANAVIPTYAKDTDDFGRKIPRKGLRGFDPNDYYVGTYTIDHKKNEIRQSSGLSANAMDKNWGGPRYSEYILQTGEYDGLNVYKRDAVRYPILQ